MNLFIVISKILLSSKYQIKKKFFSFKDLNLVFNVIKCLIERKMFFKLEKVFKNFIKKNQKYISLRFMWRNNFFNYKSNEF